MNQSPSVITGAFKARSEHGRLWNRTGATLTKGMVVQVDLACSSSEATDNIGEGPTSGLANAILPADALSGRIHAVVTDDSVADNAQANVTFVGEVEAYVIRSTGNIALGDVLTVTTAGNTAGEVAAKAGIYAIALSAATAPTTKTLITVLFNGYGFGTRVDAIT